MSWFRIYRNLEPAASAGEQNDKASFHRFDLDRLIGFDFGVPLYHQLHGMIMARPVTPVVIGYADKVAP